MRAELTLGRGEMVELVMSPLHHDAHEAEALDLESLLRVGAGDD
jgi:hypothetical protein